MFSDASNDAHAGYTLYTHLFPLLPSNYKSRFYSFDCYQGHVYEPAPLSECSDLLPTSSWAAGDLNLAALTPWRCFNPYYDPGLEPEVKVTERTQSEDLKTKQQQEEETKMTALQRRILKKAEKRQKRKAERMIQEANQLDGVSKTH